MLALSIGIGAAFAVAAVTACGDDEANGAASNTDGGGTSSSGGSSSGGSSSGGSSSGSSGTDAKFPNIGTWIDYRADAGPMPDDEYVGIYGASAEDMFIAGNSQPTLGPGGGIYRYSRVDGGLGFRNVHGNSSYHFYDIAGTSTNDVWAIGYQNSSFGWDGGAWTARPSPADPTGAV